MHRALGIVGMAAALLLAACQPLPQPFAEDRPPTGAPILTPRDSFGIEVRPVDGLAAPAASALADALAAALLDADVPAFTQGGNRSSFRLAGNATERVQPDGRSAVELRWELKARDGSSAGTNVQKAVVDGAAWRDGNPDLMQRLAKEAAPRIAALLQEEGAIDVGDGEPHVLVRPVTGAPGDGPRSLARAMVASLADAKVEVTDKEPAAGPAGRLFVVAGSVTMAPAGEGKQKVTVSWALFDPAGSQIGQVSQSNAVPAGSLDRSWGDTAYAVANAAASGIVALLQHLKTVRAGS